MSWATHAIEKLKQQSVVSIHPRGNSMTPRIKSGQRCVIIPASVKSVEKGDIVLCRVNGKDYLHLVKAKKQDRVLIGNNHGGVNGWTQRVFGKMDEANSG